MMYQIEFIKFDNDQSIYKLIKCVIYKSHSISIRTFQSIIIDVTGQWPAVPAYSSTC